MDIKMICQVFYFAIFNFEQNNKEEGFRIFPDNNLFFINNITISILRHSLTIKI